MWSELYALIAAYWIGELTEEKVSLASTFILSLNKFRLLGITKYPSLQPPAAHHLLRPSLMIVFSGQKLEIDLKFFSKLNSEYISSDKIKTLYLLTTRLISSKLSQTWPDGLFGEFKKS